MTSPSCKKTSRNLPLLNFEWVAGHGEGRENPRVARLREQSSCPEARTGDPQLEFPPPGCNPHEFWLSAFPGHPNIGDWHHGSRPGSWQAFLSITRRPGKFHPLKFQQSQKSHMHSPRSRRIKTTYTPRSAVWEGVEYPLERTVWASTTVFYSVVRRQHGHSD